MTQQSESTPISRDIPTWRERLPDTCTYPEMIAAMQAQIDDLRRENESLLAECGVRQIQGYNEGKAKAIERCVQLCLLERDRADKREPDPPGSSMNLDHIVGQGWMANLLAKKLLAMKTEG